MTANSYTFTDIVNGLKSLQLGRGDVIFSHSNLGYFGRLDGAINPTEVCSLFYKAIWEVIGSEGTVVVPTFTYSFPSRQIFDVQRTASNMGLFSEWVRKHPLALRSQDPSYSVAALGQLADHFTSDVPENSFGPTSFFDRFYKANGKILNLNFDAGSTFVHYVERELKVPYRFDKTFAGQLVENGIQRDASSTIWVRYLSDDALEAHFETFDKLARESAAFNTTKLGRGEMGLISAHDTFDLIKTTLKSRPLFLTRAETMGIDAPKIIPETL